MRKTDAIFQVGLPLKEAEMKVEGRKEGVSRGDLFILLVLIVLLWLTAGPLVATSSLEGPYVPEWLWWPWQAIAAIGAVF